ncbi:MAG: multidrug efflux SMR transporter [Nevskiaceae bacterium]|nr:MAG: multidrug efflux SMR transporter [Nevskiaceae bacterium]TBR73471.1 MAG: multidrug efflux SMR transporter [Nevskiaceae bacterium]
MPWVWLGIASIFEILFALSSRSACGYTRLWPSLLNVAAAIGGMYTLSLALLTLDVGTAYTIWTGIGATGTVLLGAWLYHERLTPLKLASIAAIIMGAVGLHALAG